MRIEVTNSLSRVWGDPFEIKALDNMTSYPIEGHEFSPAFKAHVWDGREHLLRKSRNGDFHLIPTGVLTDLDLSGHELVDCRRQAAGRVEIKWVGPPQRDYQTNAVTEMLVDRGVWTGKGMLNLPIRSGKTKIAAALIQMTGVRTLFVVPSDLLLRQTAESFKTDLEPAPVGIFGGGCHDVDWITIATVQSLLAQPKIARKLLYECDLLIVDEAHHLEGPAWRKLLIQSDSFYKVGLSATIFVSRAKTDNTKASIWLKACTGPILYRVSMNRLIQAGYLMKPKVLFYKFTHEPVTRALARDWHWLAREGIAQNPRRNQLVANLAQQAVNRGMRVLIDTGRKDQMKALHMLCCKAGLRIEMVHGQTPSDTRWEYIKAFQDRKIDVIVGTVFGEGIDIPELEVVINAEGQKGRKAAIQRMRNLTPCEGKGEVWFIDIADFGIPVLQKHSLERYKLYRGMRGFSVRYCHLGKPGRDPLAS